jgi:hypothetical protein
MKPTIKVQIPESRLVPIVSDAAIAGPVADGRLVPVLILDTRDHPSIEEVIRLHEHFTPGDVQFNWGRKKRSKDEVFLTLDFERPVEAQAVLMFSIERQGGLVDLILRSKALYLQAGEPGHRLSTAFDEPRILLTLPHTSFAEYWDGVYLKRLTEIIRGGARISRSQARDAARELIKNMRDAQAFRVTH